MPHGYDWYDLQHIAYCSTCVYQDVSVPPVKHFKLERLSSRWTGLELLLILCGGQLLSLTMHLMLLQWSTKEGKWWKIQKTRSGHWGRRNRWGKHSSGEQVLLLRQTGDKTPGASHGISTALPLLCTSASISTPSFLSRVWENECFFTTELLQGLIHEWLRLHVLWTAREEGTEHEF